MPPIISALAGIAVAAGAGLGGYAWNNLTSAHRAVTAVRRTGYVDRRAVLAGGTALAYSEGPPGGPAVLLIHGQGSARQSYDRVLPELARRFHVYAVDVAGHGESDRSPGRYTVTEASADIIDFMRTVIGEPVIVSGHSSGGLIAALVAAEAPDLVAGVLLEDPPFFSAEPERFPTQFNAVDLARPAHRFLAQDEETDFASWYIEHNAWIGYFGRGARGIVRQARRRRRAHPDRALVLWFLPPSVNESYAHMHTFDPAFADAFHRLAWQADFDHADVLRRITAPATLVHANWRITPDGILEGAMTDDDAARAQSLLPDGVLERVRTGHGFHFEDPRAFVRLLTELAARSDGIA